MLEAIKKEFAVWKTGGTCAVGKMDFDSLKRITQRIDDGVYTDPTETHDHLDFLDALARKVQKIAADAHHQLCPDAEKVLAQIHEVRDELAGVYKKLTAGMKSVHHERPKRYTGTGMYGFGAGSMKQAIAGGKY